MSGTPMLQTVWGCRWSRHEYRVPGVPDQLQPEKLRVSGSDWRTRSI